MSEATQLIDTYKRLLQMCADALEPGYDEAKRAEIRQALEQYLAGKDAGE